MTTLEDLFATNTDAEENGTWVELSDTMKFRIRAFRCEKAVKLRDSLMEKYSVLLRTPGFKLPDGVEKDVNLKVIAGAILADWTMLSKDEDGNVIAEPFSSDAAYAKLKAMPRFADWIAQQSVDAQTFRDGAKKEALGN